MGSLEENVTVGVVTAPGAPAKVEVCMSPWNSSGVCEGILVFQEWYQGLRQLLHQNVSRETRGPMLEPRWVFCRATRWALATQLKSVGSHPRKAGWSPSHRTDEPLCLVTWGLVQSMSLFLVFFFPFLIIKGIHIYYKLQNSRNI